MDLSPETGAGPLTPIQQGGSARLGSVWARDGRKSPETGGMASLRASSDALRSSKQGSVAANAAAFEKRRLVTEFIKQVTGQDVAYSNDLSFRQQLRSGDILCSLLNAVTPNATPQRTGEGAVACFLTGIRKLGLPTSCIFSAEDLESEDYDERPRIVDCLLFLRKLHSGVDTVPSPLGMVFNRELFSDVQAVRDSPRKSPPPANLTAAFNLHTNVRGSSPVGSNLNPALSSTQLVPAAAGPLAAAKPNAHMAQLYSTLSSSIMAKLTPGIQVAGPPATNVDNNISAVMEQFLVGLTVEYEKRLLAKDQELTSTRDEVSKLRLRHIASEQEKAALRGELEDTRRQAVEFEKASWEQQLSDAEGRAEALQQEVSGLRAQVERLQCLLDGRDEVASAREAEAVAAMEGMRAELEALHSIEQRYQAYREENRKLYNMVQDLKGSIRVFCRVRPLGTTGDRSSSCIEQGMDGDLAVYDSRNDRKLYKFDKVFGGDSTQLEVYEEVGGLVRSVMDGYNVCIFAYGQTGSGKTHTMTGSCVDDERGRGINYRALDDLFQLARQRDGEMEYTIQAQMVEIYNESLRDLLAEDQGAGNKLELLATQPSGLNLPGVQQIPVADTSDVLRMMEVGARNRHSAETKMNERSSRSHQVLTIIVNGTNRISAARSHACLHLIDLAGSERTDKSGVEGDRMKEANAINSSLTTLGSVMHALASKSKHIPFRDSKLTQLLSDSLSGQAKVLMFMHVAPETSSNGETISTLNFGTRVSAVTLGQAKCNVESGKLFEAHEALSKKDAVIEQLRAQLAAKDAQRTAEIEVLKAQMHRLLQSGRESDVESFCTAATHTDTAACTPASAPRTTGTRPITTPRGVTPYGDAARTPRNTMRSPAPPLALASLSRPSFTPEAGAVSARQMSREQRAEAEDVLAPLNSARGPRGGMLMLGGPKPAAGVGSATGTTTRASASSLPKPELTLQRSTSARTNGRYASAGGSSVPSTNVSQQVAALSAVAARKVTGVGRPSMGYNGSLSMSTNLSASRAASMSMRLDEGVLAGAGSKAVRQPPQSSRTSGSWKK